MFKFIAYLKFLVKSTNAHGVHSPFVFNYVTQCLYSKKRFSRDKALNVLMNSIHYFQAEKVYLENNEAIKRKISNKFHQINFEDSPRDVLFINQLDKLGFHALLHERVFHNDSMILVNSIHANQKKQQDWAELTKLPEISVSIDMFYCGAIFIRKEQVKQHFTIRI
ncbi:hypothetical protein GTQ34_00630 [Muricauda sp. JGD-17]|uniref:Uncharacterized protein n=1 Tax=Flagellimonas ochracea TaxID=2696472 RepID=A0A964TA43_9FLAO|nr:hypothetical protein [Allomuricauda ochracea]NAY90411.1 hypothetical protein [Allomuricauda ochracea]